MQCHLDLRLDVEQCRKFGKAHGAFAEASCYSGFIADTVLSIANEIRKSGVHPEVIEEAIHKIRFSKKAVNSALYQREKGEMPGPGDLDSLDV